LATTPFYPATIPGDCTKNGTSHTTATSADCPGSEEPHEHGFPDLHRHHFFVAFVCSLFFWEAALGTVIRLLCRARPPPPSAFTFALDSAQGVRTTKCRPSFERICWKPSSTHFKTHILGIG